MSTSCRDYATDLTDEQWQVLQRWLPARLRAVGDEGEPLRYNLRFLTDGTQPLGA